MKMRLEGKQVEKEKNTNPAIQEAKDFLYPLIEKAGLM